MENQEDIFDMTKFEKTLVNKKDAVRINEASTSPRKIDELDADLSADANIWHDQVLDLVQAVDNTRTLDKALSSILTLRQRILESKYWFERKCSRTISASHRQEAKLKENWSSAGIKTMQQNAKLKGENSYLEEEVKMLQAHIDFLEGSIATLDHAYYTFKNKIAFDERYKNEM
jgi:hypothetical protein